MFLIFGHHGTKIAEETRKINDGGVLRDAVIVVFQRYAHLFWLPLFPLMRNYLLHIPETGETYTRTLFQKMPEPYLSACKEVSKAAKTPWWTFIGLLIFGLLIFWLESTTKGR